MPIPYRAEFARFDEDKLYHIEGRELNKLWRAAVILLAGEMSRLDGNERRDLGQIMHAALETAI